MVCPVPHLHTRPAEVMAADCENPNSEVRLADDAVSLLIGAEIGVPQMKNCRGTVSTVGNNGFGGEEASASTSAKVKNATYDTDVLPRLQNTSAGFSPLRRQGQPVLACPWAPRTWQRYRTLSAVGGRSLGEYSWHL